MIGIETIKRLLTPLTNRIRLVIGRCVLTAINDAGGLQRVQLAALAGETLDQRERFQQYGFTSHPHPGCEAVMVSVGGVRNNAVVIACDDRRYRLRGLRPGEVAIHDDTGGRVHLTRTGITVSTPANLDLTAGGNIAISAGGNCAIRAARIELN